jgi:hypothetical protein
MNHRMFPPNLEKIRSEMLKRIGGQTDRQTDTHTDRHTHINSPIYSKLCEKDLAIHAAHEQSNERATTVQYNPEVQAVVRQQTRCTTNICGIENACENDVKFLQMGASGLEKNFF